MEATGIRQDLHLVTDYCHEMVCEICGETFDMRSLSDVLAHEHREQVEDN